MTYLHKIDPANHPAANCPLCNDPNHDSLHLFNCPDIPTTLTVWDLWTDPVGVAALLDVWREKLGGPRAGVWDPVRAHARDGVDTTTTTTSRHRDTAQVYIYRQVVRCKHMVAICLSYWAFHAKKNSEQCNQHDIVIWVCPLLIALFSF